MGDSSTWTAIGTVAVAIAAIVNVLVFAVILPWYTRARFEISFEKEKPFCRRTETESFSDSSQKVPDYWVRLRVKNIGRSAAQNCIAKVIIVYDFNGQTLLNTDPMQLHWVSTSWGEVPFRVIGLARLDFEYLDLLMYQRGEDRFYVTGDQFPWAIYEKRGIVYWLGPGAYILQVTVYGDKVKPKATYVAFGFNVVDPEDSLISIHTSLEKAKSALA